MKRIRWGEVCCLVMSGSGLVCLLTFCLSDHMAGRPRHYGFFEQAGIAVTGAIVVVGGVLYVFTKQAFYERRGFWSSRIPTVQAVLIGVLAVSAAALVGMFCAFDADGLIGPPLGREWSIGVYTLRSPGLLDIAGDGRQNPRVTRRDVTDIPARFVADPFVIREAGTYYMFFEVWNDVTNQGDIALITSEDGAQWSYRRVVLDEPYSLSYPHVFKWQDEYYMVPETSHARSIRLYKATEFPENWSFVKTLRDGDIYRDSTVFRHGDVWWMFSVTDQNDVLRLFYADQLLGPWTEHPRSPVVDGDPNIARPAGPVQVLEDRLIRFTQDCFPYYGNQVWAFEITDLTKEAYEERRIGDRPILKGYDNWNTQGMHHVSFCQAGDDRWVVAVDGR